MLASICLAASAYLPVGCSSRYLLKASAVPAGATILLSFGGGLADQIDALPVVGVGAFGIELDGLVEGRDGFVNFAGVGENCAFVVVVGAGIRADRPAAAAAYSCDSLIGLSGLGVSVGQPAMVGAGSRLNGQRLLVGLDRVGVFLGAALGIAQVAPTADPGWDRPCVVCCSSVMAWS